MPTHNPIPLCPACGAILDNGTVEQSWQGHPLGGPYRFACGSYYVTRMDLQMDQPTDLCPKGHRHVFTTGTCQYDGPAGECVQPDADHECGKTTKVCVNGCHDPKCSHIRLDQTTDPCVCRIIQRGCKATEHDYDPIPVELDRKACCDECFELICAATEGERARIERIIAAMPWSGATRAEALAAIRGGDDA